MKKNHGFSLLELLVVISIIGILISIGAVAFTTAQKTGRDARRRADVKAMQDAFEQYRAENTSYETCSTMADFDSGSGAMMPGGLPTDPKNTGSFIYNTSTGCSTTEYCVCAMLESSNGNTDAPTGTACNYLADGDYYCLRNLQ
jgi:general secretion pathway protein G